MSFSNPPFPTLGELRAMAQGAAIGARLAVGPVRWCELHPFFELLGWFALSLAGLAMLALSMPLVRMLMNMISEVLR